MTVNELASMIIRLSGKGSVTLRHVDGPQGVRGRNSDNRRLREVLGWEPSVTLDQGLEPTYRWVEKQVASWQPRRATAPRQASDRPARHAPISRDDSAGAQAAVLKAVSGLET